MKTSDLIFAHLAAHPEMTPQLRARWQNTAQRMAVRERGPVMLGDAQGVSASASCRLPLFWNDRLGG